MMKHTQLLLNLGRKVLRNLRLMPTAARPRTKGRGGVKKSGREPLLEELSQQLLKAAGCRDLKVEVHWNPRLRTTAGLACWQKKIISLNPQLKDVSQAEVQRTLRHELAHFLAQYRAGRRRIAAHGPEWREACRDLGIPRESRCHDLPFKRRRMERKHFYACRACGTELARVRPLKRAVACLKCCRKHNGGKYSEQFRFVSIERHERLAA